MLNLYKIPLSEAFHSQLISKNSLFMIKPKTLILIIDTLAKNRLIQKNNTRRIRLKEDCQTE